MLSVPFLNDKQNRRITYLRISVTSDCNLQCLYCATGKEQINSLLSFDEITKIVNAASKIGISKIRITGGEPLLRENLSKLINQISEIKGINDISITTNGYRLPELASELKSAGLNRVNISLDSLIPEVYKKINGGNIGNALKGIHIAKKYFDDVRINMVVLRGINDNEIENFIAFGEENNLTVRFLELMPNKNPPTPRASAVSETFKKGGLSNKTLITNLQKKYELTKIESGEKSSSADWFLVNNTKQKIGFISPVSKPFCASCNRMRLTSTGELIPCLHGEERISLCEAVSNGNEEEIIKKFHFAAEQKISAHQLDKGKTSCEMKSIGG
ncbi:GTP 3',8-cyclase MoaA [bacterium]|nr:GTP 3',8-cyclase MoaA [bacterium]